MSNNPFSDALHGSNNVETDATDSGHRLTALDYALRFHGSSSAGSWAAADVVITACAFADFLSGHDAQ